jgi:phage terminase small subunit
MNTNCLNSKVLTFRNDDISSNLKQSNNINQGNTYVSPIIEEQNSNKEQHIETLITENNNLKSQIAQMLLNNSQTEEIEELKTELSKAEEKTKDHIHQNARKKHSYL